MDNGNEYVLIDSTETTICDFAAPLRGVTLACPLSPLLFPFVSMMQMMSLGVALQVLLRAHTEGLRVATWSILIVT